MWETFMKTYRWLTLSAAVVITLHEAWLFAGASTSAAQIETPATLESPSVPFGAMP
jgi:hypothetical protein